MRAAVFVGPGQLELQDIPTPTAGPGELLLKVGSNTVCGTDLRIMRGEKTAGIRHGAVLGHEIGGHVTEIGAGVEGFAEGDLVAVNPTVACLRCWYCQRGMEHLCVDAALFGYSIDGGLADYVKIPAEAMLRGGVYKAADHLTPVEASLSEPLGCVLNGAGQYQPKPGDTVLIIGAGPIGLLHTQVNRMFGASQVIVSDPSAPRREVARKLGATHDVDPTATDLTEYVRSLTDGRGADVVVICIGALPLLQDGLKAARKGGHVNAFAGFPKGKMAEMDPNLIHYGELVVTGGSNARRHNQADALDLIATGAIDVKALHTHTYNLDDVAEGIEFVSSGEGIKVAISPEG